MMTNEPRWKRFAYVAVADAACRASIVQTLVDQRWSVEERPTGFHVLDDLCDVIIGRGGRVGPGLIAMDMHARGCSGISIARGLKDLGVDIPVVLVADRSPIDTEHMCLIVARSDAAKTVARLVRRRRG